MYDMYIYIYITSRVPKTLFNSRMLNSAEAEIHLWQVPCQVLWWENLRKWSVGKFWCDLVSQRSCACVLWIFIYIYVYTYIYILITIYNIYIYIWYVHDTESIQMGALLLNHPCSTGQGSPDGTLLSWRWVSQESDGPLDGWVYDMSM